MRANELSTSPQVPKGTRRFMWRLFWGTVAAWAVIFTVGSIYQSIGAAMDAAAYPPPGELVDIGGYRLHIYCMGEGSPTVVLDHVGDGNSAQWGLIQPVIARTTHVCAYDRAGFGWSDSGTDPRDARHSSAELHTLLANAGVPGPYVLAGHSYGANVARVFAAQYSDDVAGLVLIDPGAIHDRPGVPADVNDQWKEDGALIMRLGPLLARIGLLRIADAFGAMPGHGDLPAESGGSFEFHQLKTKFWQAMRRQGKSFRDTSIQVLAAEKQLGDVPLIVLSAEWPQNDPARQAWITVNESIAARVPRGVHRVVPGSTHMSLALNRKHAEATTAAILEVVEAVRADRPSANR